MQVWICSLEKKTWFSQNFRTNKCKLTFSTLISKHGEVRTTNCALSTGMCMKHDECSNNFGSYILGCFYDPFPPHLLAGDFFHFAAGDISVAGCIKVCGEAGFMLAGLRLAIWTTSKSKDIRSILIIRDRQFCHCGNVEPPSELMVAWDMCGTSCPPTPMSPPPDLGIVENCGTSLHTMVSFNTFRRIWNNITPKFLRSTLHPTPIMPSGTAPLMVGQNLTSLVSSLSQNLEGKLFFLGGLPSLSRWDTWEQGSSVDKGRRQGENMTHVHCAGGDVLLNSRSMIWCQLTWGSDSGKTLWVGGVPLK